MSRPGRWNSEDPLLREVDRVADELDLARRSAALDAEPRFPREEFRAMGDRHLLGLRIPVALGGRGLTMRSAGRMLRRLAYRGGTTFAKLSLQPEFCSVLAERGTDAQRSEAFAPLVAGRLLIGNQITEPEAGSDAGAIRAAATRVESGYRLSGNKSEAAFAADADLAIVYARTGPGAGARGISAFLVPQSGEGIDRRVIPDLGERWMRRGTVEYRSVALSESQRIGDEGAAFGYLQNELVRERVLLAAIYLGVGRASWEETVDYVGERAAFGRPLSRQQAVSFPLVEDWARLEAAESYVDSALDELDGGATETGRAGLAKWMATDVALTAIDHAIQFHGGRGYSRALPHEQRWRDVRSGAIAHGPSEIMHLVAAHALWPSTERSARSATSSPAAASQDPSPG